jgi:hypothetical protein
MSRMAMMLLPLLLLALPACKPSRPGEEPANAAALSGKWVADFTLESQAAPGPIRSERTVRGEMVLLPNSSLSPEAGIRGVPTHSGSYTARFGAFGFELSGGHEVPTLIGRLFRGDSVEIVLQPDREAPLRLAGVLSGDSVTGRWSYDSYRGGGASGRFVMQRQ